MMKKYNYHSLLVLFLLLCSINGYNQAREDDVDFDEENIEGVSFVDRLYTGGNFGLSFGTFISVDVSPIIGYRITKDFSAGVGFKYVYLANRSQRAPRSVISMYGGSVFARYLILDQFLAHAEFENLNLPVQSAFTGEVNREWVPIGLVGGGYRQGIGGNSYFQFMLLYDVIGDTRNPYISPFGPQSRIYPRIGVTIGL